MTFDLIIIAAVSIVAIPASIVVALRDGYRRVPTRRV